MEKQRRITDVYMSYYAYHSQPVNDSAKIAMLTRIGNR